MRHMQNKTLRFGLLALILLVTTPPTWARKRVYNLADYGIKANTDWKKTLGSEWRQYEEIFPKLQASNIDIISLECQNSRVPMELLELVRGGCVTLGPDGAMTMRRGRLERTKENE